LRVIGENTDPSFDNIKSYSTLGDFLVSLINDKRDLFFLYLIIKISSIEIISFLFFSFYNGKLWWLFASLFFAWFHLNFHGPFVLMMHFTSHRKFFKKEYNYANNFIPWVLGFFLGQSPKTYFYHHIFMHHNENNMADDISSTMLYKRDSFLHFINYYLKFLFLSLKQLASYFQKKNKNSVAGKVLIGEFIFYLVCIVSCLISVKMSLLFFIFPFILSRIMLSMGNWTQHAFIDPISPDNYYKNSITCINNRYNHLCWNDGYHTHHHLHPSMHWTNYPIDFQKNLKDYKLNDSVIFDGLDYFQIFFLLMIKNYKKLAAHFVIFDDGFNSEDEVISFLKARTQIINF